MSFLLSGDTCMAWIRGNRRVEARCLQHQPDLHVAAPTIMELALWLLRARTPLRHQWGYRALMQHVQVVSLDRPIAERAALIAPSPSQPGPRLAPVDLIVIATALERGLTLVTHHVQHYAHVPGLTVVDWSVP
jgi:predicted nucleic acid-binding protein